MNIKEKISKLPEGDLKCEYFIFDDNDQKEITKIYKNWCEINRKLKAYNSRTINIPELLSESVYCMFTNSGRLKSCEYSKVNTSWDCYNFHTNKRVQVKATSVAEDLTSFGPRSEWDTLIFCDFYVEGNFDGSFQFYEIPNEKVYSHKVNRNQTFKEQQEVGRRPRFSLTKDIIRPMKLKPIKIGNLNDLRNIN